ncbi:MAG: ABC transporter permease [Chitinispirillaceae bacterium]|nr:ABC transporter permease [Chitinispirillaceae bacterium]
MGRYALRRLLQAVFTVFGVMLLTFLMFRVIAGDVSSSYVNQKLGLEAKRAFNEKHKLDRPPLLNFHRRIELVDRTKGSAMFTVRDSGASRLARGLEIALAPWRPDRPHAETGLTMAGKLVFRLSRSLPVSAMTGGAPLVAQDAAAGAQGAPHLSIALSDGTAFAVPVDTAWSCGNLMDALTVHPANSGRLETRLSAWNIANLFDSQFFWHLYENITFSGRSYATEQTILETIGERGKFSLSITVPAMALGWLLAMVLASLVAFYRGGLVDRVTVFITVLGMCIPYLAYMLLGQWLMFKIAPEYASGLSTRFNIYVPVLIAVVAGLGWSVRFYRVIILNEVNKDYVRTARAKGVPLGGILFKHVLKNCMLPILTNVISEIPFLIMGALLLEKFFGVPGLGDLFLTSITSRDVPVITGLTYFTTLLYVVSLLLTDILYAVFDPRVRLR